LRSSVNKRIRRVTWEEGQASRGQASPEVAAGKTDKQMAVDTDLPHREDRRPAKETRQELKPGVDASSNTATAQANGVNGQVQLFGDRVRIGRKGFSARMMLGVKVDSVIPLSQIGSVQFRPVGRVVDGYIQFVLVGGQEGQGVTPEPTANENTVTFTRRQQPEFERLYLAVSQRIGTVTEGKVKEELSDLDYLEKVASLRDKGIITEEEFNAKKRKILGL